MSASLVGSEMCIRDSPPTPSKGQSHPPQRGSGPSAALARAPATWHKPPPVSYTHLTLPTICSV
eukprot:13617995-Alexandrium_andersonii.AAC.1